MKSKRYGAREGILSRLWCILRPRFSPRTSTVRDICRRAAQGDLEARISGINPRTSFGQMCKAINDVLDLADSYVREAAAAMENCSQDRFHRPILLRGLKGSYRQSALVINTAGLKMKQSAENFYFVQKQADENAQNIHRVAAACEELSATTAEISGRTNEAVKSTNEAVKDLAAIATTLKELNEAIAKVEGVVEIINSVAMQTNLLALNASIEAAHAGESGQGFAVVASEVKALSNSTHEATDQIANEVKHAQSTVARVSEMMKQIEATIRGVHDVADAIAQSGNQQVEATTEISRSIVDVSKNAEEVSLRITQSRVQSE
ncbi:MAG: methyl-accepting chemotaxis protein [Nibricoccus sp.]